MSLKYHTVSGKTQALFGLRHLDRLYFGGFGLVAFFMSFVAIRKKEKPLYISVALLISIMSLVASYAEVWQWVI